MLVSRYPETSKLPKAHVLSQRSMEIFADIGVAAEILARSAPLENMTGIAWYSSLSSGPRDGRGRRLGFLGGWSEGNLDPDFMVSSAYATANLPQVRLEPLLKERAESHSEATVRFGHELVDLKQDGDGVTATVLDRKSGQTYLVRAAYVLGADGGRTVADLIGITVRTLSTIRKVVSLHISADLSEYFDDPGPMIRWVFNPEHGESLTFGGILIEMGPDHWGHRSEEWTLSIPTATGDPTTMSPEELTEMAGNVLGIPDFKPTIHQVSEWWMQTALADEFQAGRVFLLGDAAHRHPPTGGLGLNSAIHDAYNLCWKIAAVLAGRAGDELLETYQVERRPVAQNNLDISAELAVHQVKLAPILGVSPDRSAEENWAALRPFWEDLPGATERRHAFSEYLGVMAPELKPQNADLGYAYESQAIVGDGSAVVTPLDRASLYIPSTRPGSLLPHAWVVRGGEQLAIRSLVHGGHFALIAGEDGKDWMEAARTLASAHGIPLRAVRIGVEGVDLVDTRRAWLRNRGITASGAVLVRPDGHIAFRSLSRADDPAAVLASVFSQVMAVKAD
jgi:2,4-dichlorophenol 6-monooxygenase